MIEVIEIQEHVRLDDYAVLAHLTHTVHDLRAEARTMIPKLKGRTVWMLNSTAEGGGVAEMLPKLVDILRELEVQTEWAVMKTHEHDFFFLTKRIHNLIHDFGEPGFDEDDKTLYERVSCEVARELEERINPEDILIVHDPQPLGVGAEIKRRTGIPVIWRCHIGLDETTAATNCAWEFLKPYATKLDHSVFSAPEYIPPYLAGKASIIYPGIDPLSHKNRELSPHKLVGVLCNAGLSVDHHPVLTPAWKNQAMRLQADGSFRQNGEVGLLFRPTVVQVSRWDRLKGWLPLLEGFLKLKRQLAKRSSKQSQRDRRIEILRLIFAGPDPSAIRDDPEGQEVVKEISSVYQQLDSFEQESVAVLTLPMVSRKENALMVNALQRCSTVVVQNSLQEGFGLTATEAMWKRVPVLGTSACGLRHQIRDGIDGRLTQNPRDPQEIAETLDEMLSDPVARDIWASNAQRRVYEQFLVFTQVESWLRQIVDAYSASRERKT